MHSAKPIMRGGLFLVLASSTIFADPVLTIQPSQLTLNPGTAFSLGVDIQGAADVYAFQFDVTLSGDAPTGPAHVTEGSFLATGGSTFFVSTPRANGDISIADTLLGPLPGVSGNGTLITLDFTPPSAPFIPGSNFSGTTTVALSNVLLLNSHLTEIPTTTKPAVVTITPEPATWGLAGVALIGLAWVYCRRHRIYIWIAVITLLELGGSAQAAAPGYTFTILAQTGDTIEGKTLTVIGNPLINNAGTIVFPGIFGGGSGIFTPSDLLVQTGDTIGGETLTNIVDRFGRAQIAINNPGTLAFVGDFAGGTGIFTASSLLVKTGDVVDGKTLLSLHGFEGRIGINDSGTVVFAAEFTPFNDFVSQGNGIFTNSGLVPGATGFTRELYNPQINNAGTVVFVVTDAENNSSIFSQSGGVGGCGSFADYPAINNAGSVAYSCGFESQTTSYSAICTTTSDCWGPGTTISGKKAFQVTFDPPALNDAGTLVFDALFQSDPRTGPDESGIVTPSELIISSKDTIAGKALTFLSFASPAINNSGIIVFHASFSDGTSGIVMATPISTGVAGDVNNDGVVDCSDLTFMTNILGKSYGQAGFDPRADVNGDGMIDIRDLAFVAQHLPDGMSCQ